MDTSTIIAGLRELQRNETLDPGSEAYARRQAALTAAIQQLRGALARLAAKSWGDYSIGELRQAIRDAALDAPAAPDPFKPMYDDCPCWETCTALETPPIPCVCAGMGRTDAALNYMKLDSVRTLAKGWVLDTIEFQAARINNNIAVLTINNCGVEILAALGGNDG